jgi:hypothetical protein
VRSSAPDAPNPRATVHEATRRSPCHGLDPTERPTPEPHRVGMTLRLPRARDGGHKPRGQGCAQLPLRDQPQHRAIPDTPRPTVLLSRAIRALTARRPFASHSTTDVAGSSGSGRRPTSVFAGQSWCGAPRRNRTGDPILTMDRQPCAVLTRVFPSTPRGGHQPAHGAAWSEHLLWEQPQESTVLSHIPAGTARPSLAQSGGVRIQDYPSIVTRPAKSLFPRREGGK